MHDIIDNRNQKLVEHINCILDSTEAARFAVSSFFLSGLEAIAGRLRKNALHLSGFVFKLIYSAVRSQTS